MLSFIGITLKSWRLFFFYIITYTLHHVVAVTHWRMLSCGKVDFWSWKLCSAWQAKQSHLSPSQLTTKANRTSAEKTARSTSVRWAARPTAASSVCLRALRAGHVTKSCIFNQDWVTCSPGYTYTGKLTGMCFLLLHSWTISNPNLFVHVSQIDLHFMKKIPPGAEASNVLVGELEFLDRPVVAFVRLAPAVLLNGLAEVPITTR